jgi:hypothetical protein
MGAGEQVHISLEFWQIIAGMIAYTVAAAGLLRMLGSYVSKTTYEERYKMHEDRLRELELWRANKNGDWRPEDHQRRLGRLEDRVDMLARGEGFILPIGRGAYEIPGDDTR